MKVQISMDDALVDRLDLYAGRNYMSRSGLISLACTQFLNSSDAILAVKDIALAIRKIADAGEIDDETRCKLEDFERLAKMISGQ